MAKKSWAMVLAILMVLACWCASAGAAGYTLKIKAWIDGGCLLFIQNNTMYWVNAKGYAPGYGPPFGNPPAPTYLTTRNIKKVAWTPASWSNGTEGSTKSDKFLGLSRPLAMVEQTVTLKIIKARERVIIYEQPTAANQYTRPI